MILKAFVIILVASFVEGSIPLNVVNLVDDVKQSLSGKRVILNVFREKLSLISDSEEKTGLLVTVDGTLAFIERSIQSLAEPTGAVDLCRKAQEVSQVMTAASKKLNTDLSATPLEFIWKQMGIETMAHQRLQWFVKARKAEELGKVIAGQSWSGIDAFDTISRDAPFLLSATTTTTTEESAITTTVDMDALISELEEDQLLMRMAKAKPSNSKSNKRNKKPQRPVVTTTTTTGRPEASEDSAMNRLIQTDHDNGNYILVDRKKKKGTVNIPNLIPVSPATTTTTTESWRTLEAALDATRHTHEESSGTRIELVDPKRNTHEESPSTWTEPLETLSDTHDETLVTSTEQLDTISITNEERMNGSDEAETTTSCITSETNTTTESTVEFGVDSSTVTHNVEAAVDDSPSVHRDPSSMHHRVENSREVTRRHRRPPAAQEVVMFAHRLASESHQLRYMSEFLSQTVTQMTFFAQQAASASENDFDFAIMNHYIQQLMSTYLSIESLRYATNGLVDYAALMPRVFVHQTHDEGTF